ncbi:MAG: endolytic transglycosylase MltG [Cyanophyceae cyanobacterium]
MKKFIRGLVLLMVLGAAVGSAWQSWAWWSWATAPARSPVPTEGKAAAEGGDALQIQIVRGTSARQIGRDLEALGVIRSSAAWDLWVRWLTLSGKAGGFQAGTYELSPSLAMPAIAERIWSGETIQQTFTIPEGWTIQQMGAYFEAQGFFRADAFVAATRKIPRDRFPWLPEGLPHLEGFLFPDTYRLPAETMTPDSAIAAMLTQFEQVALPVWEANRTNTKLNLREWVTLASIVEKESVIPQERTLIAGVFTNRLNRGQRLEADPTVEYGLKVTQTPDRPLSIAQVRTPSPYNTYLNAGLPPTAIAAPGKASLEATLKPDTTDYLFFVARYDGTHVFSKTLAEHEAAVQRIRAERRAAQQAPSPSPSSSPGPSPSPRPSP